MSARVACPICQRRIREEYLTGCVECERDLCVACAAICRRCPPYRFLCPGCASIHEEMVHTEGGGEHHHDKN